MKIRSLIIGLFVVSSMAYGQPPRTVVVNSPAAENSDRYFSAGSEYDFEIYKVATMDEFARMLAAFRADKMISAVIPGRQKGDYREFHISLEKRADRKFFVTLFKKAGIPALKINKGEAIPLSKL